MSIRKGCAAVALAMIALACGTGSAAAQEAPVRWNVWAGLNQPVGPTNDLLQGGGYVVGAGLSLTPQRGSPFSLRFDLDYNENRATRQVIDAGAEELGGYVFDGTTSSTSLTANAVYHVPLGQGVRGYVIGGVGAYYARVDLTQGGYGGGYCNPFWGYCYGYGPNYASASTTKFGWNAGLGVEFPLYRGQAWFIEARFNRIETPQPLEFVPITVGFRF